jgi:hypothetical protein
VEIGSARRVCKNKHRGNHWGVRDVLGNEIRELSGNFAELWSCAADALATVALSKFVHTTSGVDEALFAGEEGVASGTNTDTEVLHRGLGGVDRAASAGDCGFVNRWVALVFHRSSVGITLCQRGTMCPFAGA